jgi:hypothetical protein
MCPTLHDVHGMAANIMAAVLFATLWHRVFPFPALTLWTFLFPQQVTSGNEKKIVNMENKIKSFFVYCFGDLNF